VDKEEIVYRPYVIDKVKKGESAFRDGNAILSEDLKKEIASW